MAPQMTKAKLLEFMRTERAAWDALLAEVGEERMLEAGVDGAWSVKDIVSHVTYWEQDTLRVLEVVARGETPEFSEQDEMDALNARAVARNQHHAPSAVIADSQRVHQALLAMVETFPEADLIDPNRFEWLPDWTLWQVIAGESYWHYRQHVPTIRAWLDRRNA